MRWSTTTSLVLGVTLATALPAQKGYDPLAVAPGERPTVDLTVKDAARSRDIPVRVYLPAGSGASPVVLFSHGLGGSRTGSAYLGQHWASRGYVAVFMQHAGSDESVWKNVPQPQRLAAMRDAANLPNTLLRLRDVPAVLNQLARWNNDKASPLSGRLDLEHVGMSGHSFGAVTTQGVSGQRVGRGIVSFTDARISAAVVMSPSTPRGSDAAQAFGEVSIPWLLMTGTKDISPIGEADLASRLGVFPALPAGSKYELVLDNAEHSAFTDTPLPGDREPRNPSHHRSILALSTAFWDAYLRNDPAARAWLDGAGARRALDAKDRWQRK